MVEINGNKQRDASEPSVYVDGPSMGKHKIHK